MRVCVTVLVQNQLPKKDNILVGGHGEINIKVLPRPPSDTVSHLKPFQALLFEESQVQFSRSVANVLPRKLVRVLIENLDKELDEVVWH